MCMHAHDQDYMYCMWYVYMHIHSLLSILIHLNLSILLYIAINTRLVHSKMIGWLIMTTVYSYILGNSCSSVLEYKTCIQNMHAVYNIHRYTYIIHNTHSYSINTKLSSLTEIHSYITYWHTITYKKEKRYLKSLNCTWPLISNGNEFQLSGFMTKNVWIEWQMTLGCVKSSQPSWIGGPSGIYMYLCHNSNDIV